MKVSEWLIIDNLSQYIIECNFWEKDILFDWCEENFEMHSPIPYDPYWRWDFGKGPNDTMIYSFRYMEDAVAFKLRWL